MNNPQRTTIIEALADQLTQRQALMATAESCTGGGIAQALTAVAGSSAWFDAGFVTYSNQAKSRMLDVPAEVIARHGAVSEAVVKAMVAGAVA
ncbi:MAG: CinA family protein, partial [Oceanospirillum sp.]|nr:CinA family protein [Oceanospirillum sp.]